MSVNVSCFRPGSPPSPLLRWLEVPAPVGCAFASTPSFFLALSSFPVKAVQQSERQRESVSGCVCVSYTTKPGQWRSCSTSRVWRASESSFWKINWFCQHFLFLCPPPPTPPTRLSLSLSRCSRSVHSQGYHLFCHHSAVLFSVQNEQTDNEGGA